mmetsp:Transcript_29311/g.85024  ORF Transcript_29311/g.85024 Transcript_29311/m.85024 type:complete len:377 (+) Transcript_29311:358-1488(+)
MPLSRGPAKSPSTLTFLPRGRPSRPATPQERRPSANSSPPPKRPCSSRQTARPAVGVPALLERSAPPTRPFERPSSMQHAPHASSPLRPWLRRDGQSREQPLRPWRLRVSARRGKPRARSRRAGCHFQSPPTMLPIALAALLRLRTRLLPKPPPWRSLASHHGARRTPATTPPPFASGARPLRRRPLPKLPPPKLLRWPLCRSCVTRHRHRRRHGRQRGPVAGPPSCVCVLQVRQQRPRPTPPSRTLRRRLLWPPSQRHRQQPMRREGLRHPPARPFPRRPTCPTPAGPICSTPSDSASLPRGDPHRLQWRSAVPLVRAPADFGKQWHPPARRRCRRANRGAFPPYRRWHPPQLISGPRARPHAAARSRASVPSPV